MGSIRMVVIVAEFIIIIILATVFVTMYHRHQYGTLRVRSMFHRHQTESERTALRGQRMLVAGPDFRDDDMEPGLLSYAVGCAFGLVFIVLHWLMGGSRSTSSSAAVGAGRSSGGSSSAAGPVPGHTRRRSTASANATAASSASSSSAAGGGSHVGGSKKKGRKNANSQQQSHQQQQTGVAASAAAGAGAAGGGRHSAESSGRGEDFDVHGDHQKVGGGGGGTVKTSDKLTDFDDDEAFEALLAKLSGGNIGAATTNASYGGDSSLPSTTAGRSSSDLSSTSSPDGSRGPTPVLGASASSPRATAAAVPSTETNCALCKQCEECKSVVCERCSGRYKYKQLGWQQPRRVCKPCNGIAQDQMAQIREADDASGGPYSEGGSSSAGGGAAAAAAAADTTASSNAGATAGASSTSTKDAGLSFFAKLMGGGGGKKGKQQGNSGGPATGPGCCSMQFIMSVLAALFFVFVLSGGDLTATLAQYDLLLINLTTGVLVFYLSVWVCSSKGSSRQPKRRHAYNKPT